MSFLKNRLALPLALVSSIAMSSMAMAQCTDCPAGCSGSTVPSVDYYGATGTGIEAFKHHCALVTARNDAWPLPFNCWDREAYYAIWNQQFATGLQVAHLLTPEYFDANTNELNRAGEMRVAWIMQNSPISDRKIWVFEDQQGPAMDQRIANVHDVVNRWYAHMGPVEVATSQLRPNGIPASYQQLILDKHSGAQPNPVIPIEAGAALSSSVN